jgi:hypothetical protein
MWLPLQPPRASCFPPQYVATAMAAHVNGKSTDALVGYLERYSAPVKAPLLHVTRLDCKVGWRAIELPVVHFIIACIVKVNCAFLPQLPSPAVINTCGYQPPREKGYRVKPDIRAIFEKQKRGTAKCGPKQSCDAFDGRRHSEENVQHEVSN